MTDKAMTDTKQTDAPGGHISIADLLSGNAHVYEHTVKEGPLRGLCIHYRDVPPDLLETLAGAVGADLTALGFSDPLAALAGLTGQGLTGEELLAFEAARDALTTAQRVALAKVLRRVTGLMVASVVGSWSDPAAVSPEACAALPPALQTTLLELASGKTLTGADAERLGESSGG